MRRSNTIGRRRSLKAQIEKDEKEAKAKIQRELEATKAKIKKEEKTSIDEARRVEREEKKLAKEMEKKALQAKTDKERLAAEEASENQFNAATEKAEQAILAAEQRSEDALSKALDQAEQAKEAAAERAELLEKAAANHFEAALSFFPLSASDLLFQIFWWNVFTGMDWCWFGYQISAQKPFHGDLSSSGHKADVEIDRLIFFVKTDPPFLYKACLEACGGYWHSQFQQFFQCNANMQISNGILEISCEVWMKFETLIWVSRWRRQQRRGQRQP